MQNQQQIPAEGKAARKLFLIDGSGYIFRAYHALPPLTNPEGTPVGAVYGFLNMLAKLIDGTKADYIAVVFDASRYTFRNRMYEDYKANRDETPEDLIPQFSLVREATDALGIARVELEDYEADDLIATYAREAREKGIEVVIVSSDKDLMQLIGPGVRMHDPMKNKPIGEKEVMEKFGVTPDRVRDVLALIGDTSDNVPGVPGIGPKTAAELIGQYETLEGLLAHAEEIKQPKRRENIIANAEKARLSYELVSLKDDVPHPDSLESFATKKPDGDMLVPFLQQQGFKSLILRFKEKFGLRTTEALEEAPANAPVKKSDEAPYGNYALVQSEAELAKWVEEATAKGIVAVDLETTSLDATRAEIVGFSLATLPGRACYVPVGHCKPGDDGGLDDTPLFGATDKRVEGQLELKKALSLLKPLLEDPAVLKIGQNIKYDMLVLKNYDTEITPVDDTMVLSFLLAAGKHAHNMDELAVLHLEHQCIAFSDVIGKGKGKLASFAEVGLEAARDYAAEDADVTLRLWEILKPELLGESRSALYETIERPLIPVLVAMENRGIKADKSVLQHLSKDFEKRMAALETDIHKEAGHEFNVGSPKQLGEVLFDEMGLKGGKKSSKTGAYSTDSQVLEDLAAEGHVLPQKIIEWRSLSKLKSTYADALVEQINPKTGRVHTSYSMAAANTGRLSSSDPNLQNIPIRTEEGRKIRTAFIAEEGCKLISADYSQIELRLLAHIAGIDVLKNAFKHGDDIHAITASQMFGVKPDEVDSELRRKAKTINFGIIYGISAHGLATRLGISRGEAGEYIDAYFEQYPGIRKYMDETKEFAHKHGYVETLYGRRCYLPGISDKDPNRRQYSERAAINAPLQGTAADIIKLAMIEVERKLHSKRMKTKMLLQVHDELVLEAPDAEVEDALALVKACMEGAANLSIPLTVEANAGKDWGEIH